MVDQSGFLQTLLGGRLPSGLAAFELRGATENYARHAPIFNRGDAADQVFLVCRGAVRRCRHLENGRRHVAEFYLRGDLLGLEDDEERSCAAEAASACSLLSFPRLRIDALAATEPQIALYLYLHAKKRLHDAQARMMQQRSGALERIASFLLELQARQGSDGNIPIPMSYFDIGDHLGLAPETISRVVNWMARSMIIEKLEPRLLRVHDVTLLRRLATDMRSFSPTALETLRSEQPPVFPEV